MVTTKKNNKIRPVGKHAQCLRSCWSRQALGDSSQPCVLTAPKLTVIVSRLILIASLLVGVETSLGAEQQRPEVGSREREIFAQIKIVQLVVRQRYELNGKELRGVTLPIEADVKRLLMAGRKAVASGSVAERSGTLYIKVDGKPLYGTYGYKGSLTSYTGAVLDCQVTLQAPEADAVNWRFVTKAVPTLVTSGYTPPENSPFYKAYAGDPYIHESGLMGGVAAVVGAAWGRDFWAGALKADDRIIRDWMLIGIRILQDEQAVESLIDMIQQPKRQNIILIEQALASIGAPAVGPLVAWARDPNDSPYWATRIIRHISDKRAVNALVTALKEPNAEIREAAIYALGFIGEPPAIEAMIEAANDVSSKVREQVIDALALPAYHGNQAARAVIVKALKDTSPAVRAEAVRKLIFVDRKEAADQLIVMLGDTDLHVRRAAVVTLRERPFNINSYLGGPPIGDARAVGPLIEMLADGDLEISQGASITLRDITGQNFGMDKEKWKEWWKNQRGN